MIKVLVVASLLGRNGTSRFIIYFANYFANQPGFHVSLLFFRTIESGYRSNIDKSVEVNCLGIKSKLWKHIYKIIKEIIRIKPNYCVIGFHQFIYLSFFKQVMKCYGIKLLLRDTIIPSLYHENIRWIHRCLLKCAYKKYDALIAQSIDMQTDLVKNWGVNKSKIYLINNPIDISLMNNVQYECPVELKRKELFTFVAAGRLTYQKGYDIIINRLSEIKDSIPFKLIILGYGGLEADIKQLILSNHLENVISLIGYRTNVSAYLYYSDALILSSRYEGFPNIVLEAQSLGIPVFANNCPGGINEIVINGQNGWSCDFEDKESFQRGLSEFMRCHFSSDRIKKMTEERYDINVIMSEYEKVFKVRDRHAL